MQQQRIRECSHIPVTENKYRICHSISGKSASGFSLSCPSLHSNGEKVEAASAWAQKQIQSSPSRCSSRLWEQMAGISKCSPSPHLLPLSIFTPLPTRLQMANAIFDVFFFAHQTRGHSCTVPKPAADVSAQLPDNQRRWNTSLRLEVKSTKKNKCCFSQLFWLPRVSHWDQRGRIKTHLLSFFL